MKKIVSLLLSCLAVCLLVMPVTAQAADYDYIENYDVTVEPQTEDGSLRITAAFDWTALEELPYGQELKIGIPNGSIRELIPLTENIESLDNDNSYVYIYLDQEYEQGETFHFAYSWVQEYMYSLSDGGAVSYDYTPGWFDEIRVGRMRVSWKNPDHARLNSIDVDSGAQWDYEDGNGGVVVANDLDYGQTIHLYVSYADWPTELAWEDSRENLDDDFYSDWDDDYYHEDSGDGAFAVIFLAIFIFIAVMILTNASRHDGYAGGFGTRYVFVNNLWYPMGPDGGPRPGSVGTPHRPKPPQSSHSDHSSHSNHSSHGGFGGGSRGGGFGGGGFGGGGHCACASSCACACACACAGGGRAGCSAKNLYGAVELNEKLTDELTEA